MKGVLIYKLQLYYKDEYIRLFQGDCLEVMDKIIEKGIKFDAIITDPPYGTTKCKWDEIIKFNDMWDRLHKLTKNTTPTLLFGGEPFSSFLRISNIKEYKYDWKWIKTKPSGHLNAKKQPMRAIEDVLVFYKNQCIYNPQGLIYGEFNNNRPSRENKVDGEYTFGKEKHFGNSNAKGYPKNILNFANPNNNLFHPTQKPLELMEYLINTYTNENDLILDFTCGSGTTLVAAKKLNRKCIGIELEEKYCEIAKNRLIA